MTKKLISIILPVHNEEKNIPLVYRELKDVLQTIEKEFNYEIFFVNDGSKDNSSLEIKKLSEKDMSVKYITFSKNFGHHAAIEAGITASSGDIVVMMDSDLQHPPKTILEMIEYWKKGSHIVNTHRIDNEKIGLIKKITSNGFYCLLNKISDIKLEAGSADFRLIDKKVVEVLKKLPEKDKFYRGLVNWVGFNRVTISYEVRNRIYGRSSYSLRKMINLARIGITSFSLLPIKMILSFGAILTIIGGLTFTITTIMYILGSRLFSGSAILGCFILMNTGIVLVMLGINSTYLITMLKQIEGRPSYIIMDSNIDE